MSAAPSIIDRLVQEAVAKALAVAKFNENHDPDDGKFSEGGGSGGGGESSGGGTGGTSSYSAEEVTALKAYSGEKVYYSLNSQLRAGKVPDSAARRGLDSAFAKSSTSEALTVYRGIDTEGWSKVKSKFEVGSVIQDKAYTSTTTDRATAKKFGKFYVAEITVPKGTKAISMDKTVSDYSHESEVLLNRGTKFKVTSVTKTATGGRKVKMEVIQ